MSDIPKDPAKHKVSKRTLKKLAMQIGGQLHQKTKADRSLDAQASLASATCSVRTGIWKSSKKIEHRVQILGEHPTIKGSVIILWQGREIIALKREVTENTKAPSEKS